MRKVADEIRGGGAATSAAGCKDEWTRVAGQLREEIGEAAYRSWLQPMRAQGIEGGQAVVAAPTPFLRDWAAAHYADRILTLWRVENRRVLRVSIVVAPNGRVNGFQTAGGGGEKIHPP